MSEKLTVLNPGCLKQLALASSIPGDCSGWLVRVVPSSAKFKAHGLDCFWFELRGNLLFYSEDPESPPKGVVVLEQHDVELFDGFDETAFESSEAQSTMSSLKEYFTFLNLAAVPGEKPKRENRKALLSKVSVASSAMQFAFRIVFRHSPTQEPLLLIADCDQSLQMWMRALALASHEVRQILASSTQTNLAENEKSQTVFDKSFQKAFPELHYDLRQIVLENCPKIEDNC